MIFWLWVLAVIMIYLLIGVLEVALLSRRAASRCHDHWTNGTVYDRSRWVHCEPSVCTSPQVNHRIDRAQLLGWHYGLLLGWPVAVPMLLIETRAMTVADAVDPAVRRALEARTAWLEKQLDNRS